MSTVVQGLYRTTLSTPLDMRTFIRRFGQACDVLATHLSAKLILQRFATAIDSRALGLEHKGPSELTPIRGNVMLDINKAITSRERNPLDYKCEIGFLVDDDGTIYAQLFAERSEYSALLEEQPEIRDDVSYDGRTDGGPNTTEAEWQKRAARIKRLLPGLGIPAECGFVNTLVGMAPFVEDNELLAVMRSGFPDFERDRVGKLAWWHTFEGAAKAATERDGQTPEPGYEQVVARERWIRSAEGLEALEQAKAFVRSKLDRDAVRAGVEGALADNGEKTK